MSARINNLVTADKRFLEALTMLPLLTELHGSAANSLADVDMMEPVQELVTRFFKMEQGLYKYNGGGYNGGFFKMEL